MSSIFLSMRQMPVHIVEHEHSESKALSESDDSQLFVETAILAPKLDTSLSDLVDDLPADQVRGRTFFSRGGGYDTYL